MNAEEFKTLLKETNKENNEILKAEIRSSVKDELSAFKEDLKAEIKVMVDQSLEEANGKIRVLEDKLSKKDDELADLKSDFQKMKSQTIALEFANRSKNLVLFKVAENEDSSTSLLNGVCNMIRELADPSFLESDVTDIYRMGKVATEPRPIMLQLRNGSKRSYLLSQKRKFSEKKVGIAEDLPKEVQEWRKQLYQLADCLRKTGKKVVFRRDKIIVNGVELTEEQIREEQNQTRKRSRSSSPVEGTSQNNTSKRVTAKRNLRLAETPRTQRAMEQFFSPAASSMNKTYHFVSEEP